MASSAEMSTPDPEDTSKLVSAAGVTLWAEADAGAPMTMPPGDLAAAVRAHDDASGALLRRAARIALRRAPPRDLKHYLNHLTVASWDSGDRAAEPARRLAQLGHAAASRACAA